MKKLVAVLAHQWSAEELAVEVRARRGGGML